MGLLDGLLGYGQLKNALVVGAGLVKTDLGETAQQVRLDAVQVPDLTGSVTTTDASRTKALTIVVAPSTAMKALVHVVAMEGVSQCSAWTMQLVCARYGATTVQVLGFTDVGTPVSDGASWSVESGTSESHPDEVYVAVGGEGGVTVSWFVRAEVDTVTGGEIGM